MTESRSTRAHREVGRGAVGKMAVRRHDALLDGERPLGVGPEQLFVMVGFDKQAIDAGHVINHRVIGVPEVRKEAEGEGAAADVEADRV